MRRIERGLIDMCLVEGRKERVAGATKGLGGEDSWAWSNRSLLVRLEQRPRQPHRIVLVFEEWTYFVQPSSSRWNQMGANEYTYWSVTPPIVNLSIKSVEAVSRKGLFVYLTGHSYTKIQMNGNIFICMTH